MTVAFDYSKLRGRIREKYQTEKRFAASMGMSRTSLSQKLNNGLDFTQNQLVRAAKLLDISSSAFGEYFFTAKVQNHEHEQEA